ncbi:TPA: hypothetical protein PWU90_000805 [Mannheimia haemolytica]|uniref:ABC-three component system middle component 8 n=1 Tax=Mannheimia haemolytica TaxID=75985 RepID=UPI00077EC83D|nr:ABC-three component system middle component 8 [Mannheimia haemolytica]UFK41829.1 hypothetical protein LO774_08785 [Mannheimia haemolytica]HDL1112645.1 hypothetical protein [Mannheimia haemolytica]HDL1115086.1 hypothetical protein [Mannheimia haemolytica]HDL1123245.1 hypothetical protein [Mannheimia haemolytica]HDL1125848.1 hypothetical protein [Mannheimia haemolytica]
MITIRPNKYTHPDKAIISSSYELLKRLREERVVSFDEMQETIVKYTQSGNILFLPAISLLFLWGLVEYHPKNDCFEYIGK